MHGHVEIVAQTTNTLKDFKQNLIKSYLDPK